MMQASLAMVLPVVIIWALVAMYCLYDLARTNQSPLVPKWLWVLGIVILVPIGAVAYLLFEKLHLVQVPGAPPEELTTKQGGNLYFRGH